MAQYESFMKVREVPDNGTIRMFETGATRDIDTGKLDYEGFLSPLAVHRYAEYMHAHRRQADGSVRGSDNWAKGMPRREYLKSLWRHMLDVWYILRGFITLATTTDVEEALCGVIFNASGLLHEILLKRDVQ